MGKWVFVLFFSAFGSLQASKPPHDPGALKGGVFQIGLPYYPKHLIYYKAYDDISLMLNRLILEPLLEVSAKTGELSPRIAKSWNLSKDKKTFRFKLNPDARFSDGTPVTAKDVKFTYDTLINTKNRTLPMQAMLSSIESCSIVDPHTIEFRAKTIHFKNLDKLATLFVLPEHIYSKLEFNKTATLIGSGPYQLESFQIDQKITLKRNPAFWGGKLLQNLGRYNFDSLVFKVVADSSVQFEMLKKGELDYFYFLITKMWEEDTQGELFKQRYIAKLKVMNEIPYGLQGIYWNLRRPLFSDVRVRKAISHLYHRKRFVHDFFYDNYLPTRGIAALNSPYHSPKLKPLEFDPERADALLAEAGWTEKDSNGIRTKNGTRFEFQLLYADPKALRHLTVFQEDLKKAGILLNLRNVDWATYNKLIDDREFDALELARSRELDPSNLKAMWGSEEADKKGSGNFTGYKNPKVDALADKLDTTFDRAKRIALVRQIDEIISADQPLSYGWEPTYSRIAYWNRYSFPGQGYFPYSDWRDVFEYWWLDPKKTALLDSLREKHQPVPF